MEDSLRSSFSQIPVEVLEQILGNLNDGDLLSLALASPFLQKNVVQRKRCLDFSSCGSLSPSILECFLHTNPILSNLVSLDFSKCYWIPSPLVLDVVKLAPFLEDLYLLDSSLSASEVVDAVKSCQRLKRLSLTISGEDESFWKEASPTIDDCDELLTLLSRFKDVHEVLRNLTYVTLHGDCYSYVQIAVFISLTSGLEELNIEVSTLNQPSFAESIGMGSLIRRIPELPNACRNLRKFSCVINDTTKGGPFFNLVKCIKAWRSPQLQRFWVPDLPLYHLRTLESPDSPMLALQGSDTFYFHVCNYKGLRYLTVDCSMQQLVGRLPELEFLSCVFENEEVFNLFSEGHPKIQNLQLKYNKDVSQGIFRGRGLRYLSRLEKFSVDSSLLHDIRSSNQVVDIFHVDALDELSVYCRCLEELEFRKKNYRLHMGLEVLQKFPKLKLLSIQGSVVFPAEEFVPLSNLRVLRLGSTPTFFSGSPDKLGSCFPSLQNLKLICDGYSEMNKVLLSLERCASLQRVTLLKPSNNPSCDEHSGEAAALLLDNLRKLCSALPGFTAAYIQYHEKVETVNSFNGALEKKPSLFVTVGPEYCDSVPRALVGEMIETSDIFLHHPF